MKKENIQPPIKVNIKKFIETLKSMKVNECYSWGFDYTPQQRARVNNCISRIVSENKYKTFKFTVKKEGNKLFIWRIK